MSGTPNAGVGDYVIVDLSLLMPLSPQLGWDLPEDREWPFLWHKTELPTGQNQGMETRLGFWALKNAHLVENENEQVGHEVNLSEGPSTSVATAWVQIPALPGTG